MIKVGLKVDGADELAAALRGLGEAVRRRALLGVLRAAGEPIRARMSDLARRGPVRRLAGGGGDDEHLADNIGISAATRIGSVAGGRWDARDEMQAAVAIGPTSKFFYGIYLEYGTVHAPTPRPFGRPAFDGESERALDLIRRGLWDLLADAAAKRGAFKDRS